MELAFDTISLRTICENEQHAISELGVEVAEVLKHRLADLQAATSVKDIIVGRLPEFNGTEANHLAIYLSNKHSIVLCANHPKNPMTDTGEIDWERVSRVKILRIESNYD